MILPWESTLSPRWNTTRDFVIFFDVCRELPAPSKKETLQKTLITTYISIDGGLQPVTDVLLAIARSFASYTAIRCVMGSQGGGPDGPKIDGMEVLTGNGGFKTIHSKSADFDSGFICCLRCGMLQAVWWICFNTSILEWQFIDVGLIMVWLVSRLLLRPSIPQMMPNATHEISWMNYWVGSWRRGSLRQPKRRHVRNTWMHSRQIPTQSVEPRKSNWWLFSLLIFCLNSSPSDILNLVLFSSHACLRSDLLDAVVPTESDVEVTDYHGIWAKLEQHWRYWEKQHETAWYCQLLMVFHSC